MISFKCKRCGNTVIRPVIAYEVHDLTFYGPDDWTVEIDLFVICPKCKAAEKIPGECLN